MDMGNCEYDKFVEFKSKSVVPFVIGILLTVSTVIMFFIGTFGSNQSALWIASAITGVLSLVFLTFAIFTTDGWMRMFGILFIVAVTAMITYMATSTWA